APPPAGRRSAGPARAPPPAPPAPWRRRWRSPPPRARPAPPRRSSAPAWSRRRRRTPPGRIPGRGPAPASPPAWRRTRGTARRSAPGSARAQPNLASGLALALLGGLGHPGGARRRTGLGALGRLRRLGATAAGLLRVRVGLHPLAGDDL